MHAFDRQTDRQTDRILIARPHLHSMQRGKNESIQPACKVHVAILLLTLTHGRSEYRALWAHAPLIHGPEFYFLITRLVLYNWAYGWSKFYIVVIGIFDRYCSCDLDPMIFIYEPDRYSLEIHWMCKWTSQIKASESYHPTGQTDRQTDTTEIMYNTALQWSKNLYFFCICVSTCVHPQKILAMPMKHAKRWQTWKIFSTIVITTTWHWTSRSRLESYKHLVSVSSPFLRGCDSMNCLTTSVILYCLLYSTNSRGVFPPKPASRSGHDERLQSTDWQNMQHHLWMTSFTVQLPSCTQHTSHVHTDQ